MRPPDVLTPEEITALLEKLPEPLRTACELDAFTGLRRGELIGLQWQDVAGHPVSQQDTNDARSLHAGRQRRNTAGAGRIPECRGDECND